MGPLIMIHAWVHLSASLQPPLTTLTAGHSITSDSVSPICVTGTKTYDSPPQPTAPVSEVINFSSSRCGDGDPGNTGRGSQWCQWCAWCMADIGMTRRWWHLVTGPLTSHRDPAEISTWHDGHWDSRTPRAGIIFHRNWKWFLALPHSFYYPWPGSSLIPPVSFNWFITTMGGETESLTTPELGPEKGNSLCQWNDS